MFSCLCIRHVSNQTQCRVGVWRVECGSPGLVQGWGREVPSGWGAELLHVRWLRGSGQVTAGTEGLEGEAGVQVGRPPPPPPPLPHTDFLLHPKALGKTTSQELTHHVLPPYFREGSAGRHSPFPGNAGAHWASVDGLEILDGLLLLLKERDDLPDVTLIQRALQVFLK